jgi:multidrug efflux pump subunit AcrA (membrane-fusion protein)
MKTAARVMLTLVLVAAGCIGGYELWDYYMISPWTRDARVQADVVGIAPDLAGFVDEVRVKDNQFMHKGDILVVLDRERYTRALVMADATVAAREADMQNAAQQAARRAKLTEVAISNEARDSARLSANAAAASYQQAVADRSTAHLNLDRTILRSPVNGFVTNLTLEVGQYASVGTKIMALIDATPTALRGISRKPRSRPYGSGKRPRSICSTAAPPCAGMSRASPAASPMPTMPPAPNSSSILTRLSSGSGLLSGSRCASVSTMCPRVY